MNSIFKASRLVAVILGLAMVAMSAFAETSSGAGSTSSKPVSTGSDASQTRRTKDSPPDQEASTNAQPRGSTDSQPKDSTDAQPRVAPQGSELFKLIDTDKDGRISLAEYVAYGKSADPSAGSGKTATRSDSDRSRRIKDPASAQGYGGHGIPPDPKTVQADKKPAAVPEPDSPGPSLLPSVSTRADKFTAEVFANLDIDHDKFLSQAELDALIGAHQISQP